MKCGAKADFLVRAAKDLLLEGWLGVNYFVTFRNKTIGLCAGGNHFWLDGHHEVASLCRKGGDAIAVLLVNPADRVGPLKDDLEILRLTMDDLTAVAPWFHPTVRGFYRECGETPKVETAVADICKAALRVYSDYMAASMPSGLEDSNAPNPTMKPGGWVN